MEETILKSIASFFVSEKEVLRIAKVGSGHIHKTFKLEFEEHPPIILQEMNTQVFRNPLKVTENMIKVSKHLIGRDYPYQILSPIKGKNGFLKTDDKGSLWRAFPFIEETITTDQVSSPQQAYEAAKAFGDFLKGLDGIDNNSVVETIPDFHNLELRYQHFQKVSKEGEIASRKTAIREIERVEALKKELYFNFNKLPVRIVHNDTKISNVLLDQKNGKGICVIDLDTVMPGWVVTDFGDLIRTFCCTADENETDLEKVALDTRIFKAMADGFLTTTKSWLLQIEIENLVNGGIYIIFEQAIRFLSDYLAGDVYYPVSYEHQNLDRTRNQLKLLECLLDKQSGYELIIREL